MCVTLWKSKSTTWLDSLEDLSVPRRWLKISGMYIFSNVTVEGRVVDSNMNGFSGNLFAVLDYYLEVKDVGLGVVIRNAVFVNCTSDMTSIFFYSIL